MVGIDVTHPGFNSQKGIPPIAVVVANVDDNFVQFLASLRIQQITKKRYVTFETNLSHTHIHNYTHIN